jgi:hypothetical protein
MDTQRKAWIGMARRDCARQGVAREDKARLDKVRRG